MPMDDTDKRLVNGLIYLVVFGAVAYWLPGYGYSTQSTEEETARGRLNEIKPRYETYFPPMHAAHFGNTSSEPVNQVPGMYISELKNAYIADNKERSAAIAQKEQVSRMNFPGWTEIPDDQARQPGAYFRLMWQQKRGTLSPILNEARVECEDPNIGFTTEMIQAMDIDLNKAKEQLRELCIVEKVIELCVDAKKRQEKFEKSMGWQPESFMKIISVKPQESVPTGYSALVENKNYNPKSGAGPESLKRFKIEYGKKFIQEYPVQIELQCDVNTFMRFLYSVRSNPGQFLVIRSLDILSESLSDSDQDTSELKSFVKDIDAIKKLNMREEHILVRMSAAGMDFFDPALNPNGLYVGVKGTKAPLKRRHKYEVPSGL